MNKISFNLPAVESNDHSNDDQDNQGEITPLTTVTVPPPTSSSANTNQFFLESDDAQEQKVNPEGCEQPPTEAGEESISAPIPEADLSLLTQNPPPLRLVIDATRDMLPHFANSVCNQLGSFVGQSILMMSIGRHYTVTEIASVGVGMSVNSICGIAVAVGASSGCETLISQAFGRGDLDEVALWTQLGTIICLALCVPISAFFVFSAPVIEFAFGPVYVDGASSFLRWVIPFLFVQSGAACIIKSFQCSGRADVPAKARFFSVLVMVLGAVFVVPGLGIPGAALSMFFGSVTQVAVMLAFVFYSDDEIVNPLPMFSVSWNPIPVLFGKTNISLLSQQTNQPQDARELETRTEMFEQQQDEAIQHGNDSTPPPKPFSFLTRHHVWTFAQVAAPGASAVLAEWGSFELMTLIASHISSYDLAAFQIYLAVSMLFLGFAFGLSVTTSAYVGKLLGANDPKSALLYGKTCVIWSIALGFATGVLLLLLNSRFFALYSEDDKLVAMLTGVIPIYCVLRTVDNVQIVLQGICRGAAMQKMVPFAVAFALTLVGIPLAYLLGDVLNFQLAGVLIGFCSGLVTLVPILLWKMKNWNWIKLAEEASRKREERKQRTMMK